ncbi:copper homeostasis protein CutC [Curtobacterium sp. MCBD17_035]|uniref:copper homeostasis protein CutC n=1 Tax=Curtobacterium sp. MCBD17_035 TaxID=2175673 RepID=UPI0021AC96C5|nr:copper homeostasis protein CutC [Curtobacterium sp. MCBD17_035]WIB67126.1 copper homeostasis protein CutC [Curtobacterium sp. MCBD17_035]
MNDRQPTSAAVVGPPGREARPALEIAVTSAAGAVVARDGGADRVELCTALELGGVTPAQGLVEAVVTVGIPAHVLVRCRPGDFVYDEDEIATMIREVRAVVASGARGVVVGALGPDGMLDIATIARLRSAARDVRADVEVTVHRAIDHAADPIAAAATLPTLGVTRVLTSGGAATAPQGLATITRMVAAAGPVQVMAGSGVAPQDVPAFANAGVAAVHLSAKRLVAGRGTRASRVPMGVAGEDTHLATDPAVVAAARAAVDAVR